MEHTPFRVGIISRTFYYVPVWAALEQGFFAGEQLGVELVYMGSDLQAQALLDGRLDIAVAPPEGVLQNAQAGGPLRILAGNSGKLSHLLMARPDIDSVESLRGRVFGILSRTEGSFFHFQELAEKHGLHYPGDYLVVETGGAPDRHRALLEGRIDAGLQSVPWCFVGEEAGLRRLADISDYIPDWQFNTVNADIKRIASQRERYAGFLRALQKGVDWTYANRDSACAIAARQMNLEPRFALQAWEYFTSHHRLTRDQSVNKAGLVKVIEAQVKAGLLPSGADNDLSRFVNESLLAETLSIQAT